MYTASFINGLIVFTSFMIFVMVSIGLYITRVKEETVVTVMMTIAAHGACLFMVFNAVDLFVM